MLLRSSLLGALLLLAGCGGAPEKAAKSEDDAVVAEALGDPIMVDPALDGQNQARAGMAGGGAASAGIPPEQRSPEAIALAIGEATRLAGGSIRKAPAAKTGPDAPDTVTAGQLAARTPGGSCAGKVEYSAVWAARLPAVLAVYPRGHVQEAAGTDQDGCRLRVVNFVTPVGVSDVVNYYFTRLTAAGYDAEHRSEGKDMVLGGSKGASAYVLYVRKRDDSLTEADLVSNGG